MLSQLTAWLGQLAKDLLSAYWQLMLDLFTAIIQLLMNVIVGLVSAIPIPAGLSAGLQSVFGSLDPGVLWLVSASGLPAGMVIIGGGYLFRLTRKVVTLFQW